MATGYRFCCTSCGADIHVDAVVRRDTLRDGCFVCRAEASDEDFTPLGRPLDRPG